MSDNPPALPGPVEKPSGAPAPAASYAALDADELAMPPATWWQSRFWALALLAIATVALAASMLLWQRLGTIQQELARRSTDAGTQAIEARTLARQAQEGMQELSARLAITETRLGEVSLQRTQLEELMQSLSRTRDENLVVDLESALRLAQQQAQLTGSAEPLLAALKTAEQRLARAAQPRLSPVQRAVARDAERIKSAVLTDVPALLMKVDELTRMVDELPVANAFVTASTPLAMDSAASPAVTPASDAPGVATANAWFSGQVLRSWVIGALASVRGEAAQLLRVSRIDHPEAALLAPEQAFFLRENLKLKLLNARMALLSRQTDTARADLLNVQATLARYYDPSARRTHAAVTLLQQVQGQLKNSELPRLDETLAALATAAAGR